MPPTVETQRLDRAPVQGGARDEAREAHRRSRALHWDRVAGMGARCSGGYHRRLERVYRTLIPPGLRVLEIGCAQGDLLAAVKPAAGVGIDLSGRMVEEARRRHPEPSLRFIAGDAHDTAIEGPFDAVILSDVVNDLWDVQRVLERVRGACTERTRVVINAYSRLWEWPLAAARKLGLARPMLRQSWLTREDITNLLDLAGFETIRTFQEVLWPVGTPVVAPVMNRVGAKLWPLRHLCLTNFVVARPKPIADLGLGVADLGADFNPQSGIRNPKSLPSVTVVVPARNEEGNVPALLERIPAMGSRTEVIFVEGNSTDGTWGALERGLAGYTRLPAALLKQRGKGKGDAVRLGMEAARGDIVMILDADLTVPPEDLPRFYEALRSGTGEFINGVRLVYPMQERAMRLLNVAGNKFFSLAFSWILGQRIKDTLCGTKALWREDYGRIAAGRGYFGDFDPFGDFDLIFGAAKLNLKIIDLPVRYRERTYGDTNIHRWRHGLLLLRMAGFAARRLKFV